VSSNPTPTADATDPVAAAAPPGGLSRRSLLRAAGLGAAAVTGSSLLAACGSSSSSSASSSSGGVTDLSVQLCWVEDSSFSQFYIADTRGYLKQNNVALKLIPGGADITAIEGIVAGGGADVGMSTDMLTLISAIADGNPLICIGAFYQANLNVLMSDPKNPITSVRQLVGKKIGANQGYQGRIDAMFKLAGLKPDYTFVPTGYGPGPLIKGQVDAQSGFITDEVLSYQAETGSMPGILTFTKAGLPTYTQPIYVTTDTLKEKRDALKGMLAALKKATAVDVADPSVGSKLAVTQFGKSDDLKLASEIQHNKAYTRYCSSTYTKQHGYLWVEPSYVAGPIIRGMKASGLKTTDVSKIVDTSLLTEI
jgi:ABC-type nitrate/sulfonate/bicarbonate transport system substrate-binding protein